MKACLYRRLSKVGRVYKSISRNDLKIFGYLGAFTYHVRDVLFWMKHFMACLKTGIFGKSLVQGEGGLVHRG